MGREAALLQMYKVIVLAACQAALRQLLFLVVLSFLLLSVLLTIFTNAQVLKVFLFNGKTLFLYLLYC